MSDQSSRIIPISLGMVSVYVIRGSEGTILIDTGTPGSETAITDKMLAHGIDPKEIKLIVLTHAHEDHFGSAKALKEKTGARVAIHSLDADNLRAGRNGELRPTNTLGKIFSSIGRRESEGEVGMEPDILLDEEYDLTEYGISGKVISTPGHTPGSVSVLLDSKEAIVGDLVMAFYPKTKPKYPMFAQDISEVKRSLRKVMGYSPDILYPAHGGPFTGETMANTFDLKD